MNEREHIVAVLFHIEFVMKDRFDSLIFTDDERVASGQTHEGPEHVEVFGDAFVRIGDERKGDLKFPGKLALRIELVRTDSDEVCSGEEQFVEVVGKSASFASAMRGEGFGEEVDDRAEACLFGQDEVRAFVCLGRDLGCSITHFQRRHLDAG